MAQKKWTVTLNTGAQMPSCGFGTFSVPETILETAVKEGYRCIDCAHMYGNEAEIGQALQKCIKEGVVKREELFITSKLWSTDFDDVTGACQTTLKNLQLDYLDLYLLHWPFQFKKGAVYSALKEDDKLGYNAQKIAMVWKALEECVSKGLTKAIGISNFTITKTENLLKTVKIVPAVNQVECHPYFQQPKLKKYCDSKGIVLEGYYPLGNPGRYRSRDEPIVIDDPVILDIAEKHKATAAQVCISFGLHRGMVVVPKTVTPARITENFKSVELKLDEEDMRRLKELDKNYRLLKAEIYLKSGDTLDSQWDIKEDSAFKVN